MNDPLDYATPPTNPKRHPWMLIIAAGLLAMVIVLVLMMFTARQTVVPAPVSAPATVTPAPGNGAH